MFKNLRLVNFPIFIDKRITSQLHLSKTFNRYYGNSFLNEAVKEFGGSYNKLRSALLTSEGNNSFWKKYADSKLTWSETYKEVNSSDFSKGRVSWFTGGKLNVSENCVDRHARTKPDHTAIIWEKDEPGQAEHISYRELLDLTCRIANILKEQGVKKGDRVIIYMPMTPLITASMLACARIGAIHSIVFAGFSSDALASRIQDARARVIITADQAVRGGKVIQLKRTVDDALLRCEPGSIKSVLVQKRTNSPDVPMGKNDIDLNKALESVSNECAPNIMNSEDFLFILYTSGSTGKPKGIAHSTAGYLLYAAATHEMVFDYDASCDKFGCVADVGWITGHSYAVYGPLCNGGTTLLFESTPIYPNPGRYWEMVERLKLNQIYLAPTALRLLLKHGDEWVVKYDRSSLKKLGCVGEPLNKEAWQWYYHVVGEERCDIVDTWWQTETGGIMISPRPSETNAPILPGMPMRPLPGIDVVLLNDKGSTVDDMDARGALCVRREWPGMAITCYGDHSRFVDTYFKPFPGFYFSGDGAHRHADGNYQITGRVDDVINTSGHRLGTAEIEDALTKHSMVAETAVVGYPHDIKGEAIYAYVTLKEHVTCSESEIRYELREYIKKQVAPYAMPEIIQIVGSLPKTRSGKIMRRILRKIAHEKWEELGDTSTLADPNVVDELIKNHKDLIAARAEKYSKY